MTELNPTDGENLEKDDLNHSEEDEIIEDEDLNFLDEEEKEREQEALDIFNKRVGKSYKSWEDVAKSEKQRDIEFAKKPPVKKEKQEETKVESDFNVSERILRLENKELGSAMDDIISEIKKDHPGKDPLQVWESYEFYKKEANARAEKEKAKQRISNPSGNAEGEGERDDMSDKFMKNLPPGFSFKK